MFCSSFTAKNTVFVPIKFQSLLRYYVKEVPNHDNHERMVKALAEFKQFFIDQEKNKGKEKILHFRKNYDYQYKRHEKGYGTFNKPLFKTDSLLNQSIKEMLHRKFHTSTLFQNKAFTDAQEDVKKLTEDPGNATKLKLYALFKQGSVGKCNVPKPGMLDMVGKAKWDAWNQLGELSQESAQQQYIDTVQQLLENDPAAKKADKSSNDSASTANSDSATGKYTEILATNKNGIFTITLNRPKKYNAITLKMYEEWSAALKESENSDSVVTVITGAGDYYCAGNDLGNFMNIDPDNISKMAEEGGITCREFVASFIDHPKPLIALINGHCIGISCTVLGLFDAVFATEKATFHTPFSSLGQSPEGCSSYTFPKLMGTSKANEMLLFNRKLTAAEACERGLVTRVFSHDTFKEDSQKLLEQYGKLSKLSLMYAKKLRYDLEKDTLHAINKAECERLVERWQSEDCMNALMEFFTRKME